MYCKLKVGLFFKVIIFELLGTYVFFCITITVVVGNYHEVIYIYCVFCCSILYHDKFLAYSQMLVIMKRKFQLRVRPLRAVCGNSKSEATMAICI